jgi:DNA-binding transcriptional MerR regulator
MKKAKPTNQLPPIPEKRYFTIGEVAELCEVKPHVLRYWEQEFSQLKPSKRKGSRRYYQHKDIVTVRSIRELLYDNGFTINGARQQLRKNRGSASALTNQISEQASTPVKQESVSEAVALAVAKATKGTVSPQQSLPLGSPTEEALTGIRQSLEALLEDLKA